MASTLLKKIYRLGKQILPVNTVAEIDILFQRAQRIFNRQDIADLQRSSYPGATIVEEGPAFVAKVFGAFYRKQAPSDIVPGKKIAFAESWVPFYKESTAVVLYNFFARNYGIRDPIYYRFVLFSGSKPIRVHTVVLAADAVLKPDFSQFWDLTAIPKHAGLLLQAFHPRIKTPNNQLRYFVLHRNPRYGFQCGTHSMQLAITGVEQNMQPSLRSYAPDQNETYYFTPTMPHERMTSGKPLPGGTLTHKTIPAQRPGMGYLIIEDSDGYPAGIWHDGATSHRMPPAQQPKNLGSCKTAFSIPNFAVHAPVLLVCGHQIGFTAQVMTFKAFNEKNQLIAEKKIDVKVENSAIDLKDVFKADNLQGLIHVEVDFHHDFGEFAGYPACFLHLYYRSAQGFGDQVHSLSSFGFTNDVKPKHKSYRCRKFAPLLVEPGLEFLYSIVNVGSAKPNEDTVVKLRVFSDTGAESVLKLEVPAQGIGTISSADVIASLKGDIRQAGIVFLEHETTNFNASYLFINKNNNHLGVDHFTGG